MKRILFILHNHFVNDARVLKEARSLVAAGHEVTVRCLGDGVAPTLESYDGIYLERKHVMPRDKHYSLLSKMLHIFWFMLKATRKARQFDAVHCHDLAMLPVGVWVKYRYGKKHRLVYDCHEYETEVQRTKPWLKPISKVLERALIGAADAVICVSDSIAEDYARIYNIKKPYLVLNCPPLRRAEGEHTHFRDHFGIPSEHTIFLYQGALIDGRGIPSVIQAFAETSRKDASLVVMGYGKHAQTAQEAAENHSNIYYHEAVPAANLLDYTASADVGLCFIEDVCLSYRYCLPNKLFEYQMAGLPVIASALPELTRVLTLNNTGILVPNQDVEALKAAIENMDAAAITELSNGLKATTDIYNWENQAKTLNQLYAELGA